MTKSRLLVKETYYLSIKIGNTFQRKEHSPLLLFTVISSHCELSGIT